MDNDKANKVHETQSNESEILNSTNTSFIDDQLLPMQKIEGGGPPKRIDLSTMPKPLRILGYFFFAFILIMFLVSLFVSIFK
ncbi:MULTISPECIES: hypothetical protein [Bacteria]|uniref:hypothetical protein n=1 Tax=Bacteria TaxID=2 RepID=UPI0006FE1293|nr:MULTISPECIES: hypothetical protein [Bacteria]KRE35292.1 hypothetical protein ASG81_22265 [Paenibacillus sp. Soil522]